MGIIVDVGNAPARARITIVRGDSFDLPITVLQNGSPKDLTGFTPIGELRDADGLLIHTFGFTNDLPNGLITPTLTPTETPNFDGCTEYGFAVALDSAAPTRDTLLAGPVRVLDEALSP